MSAADRFVTDEKYMRHALRLARRGIGRTSPSPMVGCVVVKDDEIIAEACHSGACDAHAEAKVLQSLMAAGVSSETRAAATLYVNLEPRCRDGSTPACTRQLIEHGIGRVVIGVRDPDPQVSGQGIEELRRSGIEVVTDVLADECAGLNRMYFKYITTGIPWVTLKFAMSLDGKIATRSGDSKWITSDAARARVHEMRNELDAVLVGTETAIADNPRLTCRVDDGRNPIRIVLDARDRVPRTHHVFDGSSPTLLVRKSGAARLERPMPGVDELFVAVDSEGHFDIESLLLELGKREIVSILVEGGGELHGSFLDSQCFDSVFAFVAPLLIGGNGAPSPVAGCGFSAMSECIRLTNVSMERCGVDFLLSGEPIFGR